jgi:hypothetical protein
MRTVRPFSETLRLMRHVARHGGPPVTTVDKIPEDVRTNIYFIEAPSARRIKIGKTDHLRKRFCSLRISSPVPIKLVAFSVAHPREEYVYHRRFDASRYRGEWFDESDDLRSVIATLQAQFPLPEWADEDDL